MSAKRGGNAPRGRFGAANARDSDDEEIVPDFAKNEPPPFWKEAANRSRPFSAQSKQIITPPPDEVLYPNEYDLPADFLEPEKAKSSKKKTEYPVMFLDIFYPDFNNKWAMGFGLWHAIVGFIVFSFGVMCYITGSVIYIGVIAWISALSYWLVAYASLLAARTKGRKAVFMLVGFSLIAMLLSIVLSVSADAAVATDGKYYRKADLVSDPYFRMRYLSDGCLIFIGLAQVIAAYSTFYIGARAFCCQPMVGPEDMTDEQRAMMYGTKSPIEEAAEISEAKERQIESPDSYGTMDEETTDTPY